MNLVRRIQFCSQRMTPSAHAWGCALLMPLLSMGCADVLGIPDDLEASTTTSPTPGPLVLRDGRLGTQPAQPASIGTLRIADRAFERGARTCTLDGAFCVVGGLTARGQAQP